MPTHTIATGLAAGLAEEAVVEAISNETLVTSSQERDPSRCSPDDVVSRTCTREEGGYSAKCCQSRLLRWDE